MAEEVLFSGNSVFDIAREYPRHAVERAGRFTESELLNNSTDHLIGVILDEYALDVPVLLDDEVWIDEKEVESIRRPNRYSEYSFTSFEDRAQKVKEHFVVFHLPFRGDRDIFRFEPSRRILSGLQADIGANELVLNFRTAGRDQQRIRADIDGAIAEIRQHLDQIRLDFQNVPSQIDQTVRHWIEQRKVALLQQKGTVAALGFPMKKRPDAPTTYRAPEMKRKIAQAAAMPASAPFKPEPTMDEADYRNILGIIENMTTVMERSPQAFKGMGEEDIRSHYLVQLNGQYEGGATGETFNAAGKTDILVRSDNANIFIAECKIWRGDKVMTETVDQLLSYVTWRDTKTAIIVFNRNKNFSAVIEGAKRAVEAHPQYRRGPVSEGETRFRFILANPDDTSKEVVVTLMLFDIPG